MRVYNIDEAMNWFLKNSKGSVVCVKGLKELEAFTYPEAEDFFISELEGETL